LQKNSVIIKRFDPSNIKSKINNSLVIKPEEKAKKILNEGK